MTSSSPRLTSLRAANKRCSVINKGLSEIHGAFPVPPREHGTESGRNMTDYDSVDKMFKNLGI